MTIPNPFDEIKEANFAALRHALPPNNLEAEAHILGAILLDPAAMPLVDDLEPSDFFNSIHRRIFAVAQALHSKGEPTHLMNVSARLHEMGQLEAIGGTATLAQLVDQTVSSVNIDRYAALLKEKSIRRQLIAMSFDMAEMGYDELVNLGAIKRGLLEKLDQISPPGEKPAEQTRRQSDRLVSQVKSILLDPMLRPHDRKLAMGRLAKRTGHTPGFLEDLFYLSQIADDNEPLMSLRDLWAQYGDQVESWLVHGFLNRGRTTLLHAKGGTGKSLLSYDLIYAIVHGQDWGTNGADNYGFPVTKRHRAMIIQTDESPGDLAQHLEQRGFDLDTPDVRCKTKWNIAHLPHLYEEVREFRPDLILIDSLTSVSAKNCVSENDMEYARPVLALNAIASEFGCHILILHHSSRGAGEARGTTALEAAVSQVWKLERDGTGWASGELAERLRLLTITKSRARRPAVYRIELNPETFGWHCLGEVNREEEPQNLTTKQHIINFLRERPGVWYEAMEIAYATNCTLATVRRCANELAIDKIINPKKRPGRRAKLYSLGDPQEVIGSGGRSLGDHLGDHFPNPDTASDSIGSDQVIAQISNFCTETDEKISNLPDHLITSSPTPDTASDSQVIAQVIAPPSEVITSPKSDNTDEPPITSGGARMITYGGIQWELVDSSGWIATLANPRDPSDTITVPKSELDL